MDQTQREEKLDYFLNPLIEQWRTPSLRNSLSSFNGFCELLGLGSLQQYALSRGMHRTHDWSSQPLDEEGRVLQSRIQDSLEVSKGMILLPPALQADSRQYLPLRATKTFLSVSIERLEPGSRPHSMACSLWHKNFTSILPNLLHFIR